MFKVPGLGYHLLIPITAPEFKYSNCEKQTNFTEDQDIFHVTEPIRGITFTYGIPCKAEAEAYTTIYWGLGRTWNHKKGKIV